MRFIDLTGKRFGKLLVVSLFRDNKVEKDHHWKCKCDCGSDKIIRGHELRGTKNRKGTISCGCEVGKRGTHFLSKSKEYGAWHSMKDRCYNLNNPSWHNYGGRGITVCESWQNSFIQFYKDMGKCPEKYTLERLNVNEGYCLKNCIWANWKTQANNKRNNKLITLNNSTHTLSEWSEITGIKKTTLHLRIKQNWDIERALTQPVRTFKDHPPL